MTRWRIDLSYDGTNFSGWASQPDLRTVQGEIELWLPRVLRVREPIGLTVAGRTDAGVHAVGQVAHFDFTSVNELDLPATTLRRLSRVLPEDIVIKNITQAPKGFDARFSASWRRYCYHLWDLDTQCDPRKRYFNQKVPKQIDLDLFNQAAGTLLGLMDFAAFSKPRLGATTIRHLFELSAIRIPDGTIQVWVKADAFCHSMVRSLVGALTSVATGQRDLTWLAEVSASKKRHNEVQVMPAKGLTLMEVGYPSDEQLADRANTSRALRKLENS